jgi:hypothetical protein
MLTIAVRPGQRGEGDNEAGPHLELLVASNDGATSTVRT